MRLKLSQARIMKFIEVADPKYTYAKHMSQKLQMDYIYLINILGELKFKKWIRPVRRGNRVFYELNKSAPLDLINTKISR
jgi:hypothetical protein